MSLLHLHFPWHHAPEVAPRERTMPHVVDPTVLIVSDVAEPAYPRIDVLSLMLPLEDSFWATQTDAEQSTLD